MQIDSFFLLFITFFIKIIKSIKPFFKGIIIIIATICFLINWLREKRIYDHIRSGYLDLVDHSTIIEYFVWDLAFDKSRTFSLTAERSVFLAGSFCLKRGFYIRYEEIIFTLPYFSKRLVFPPLSAFAPLLITLRIDVIKHIERCSFSWVRKLLYFFKDKFYNKTDIITLYYVDIDYIIRSLRVLKFKRFIYGRISTVFFSFSDDFERIFVTRRWVHNFILEIT